eukprot:357485-Chlamydomonas_euryale.AAC.8
MDQFSAASRFEKFCRSGATTGTFLMATPDCRAVHSRKYSCDPVLASVVPRGHLPQLTLPMSNETYCSKQSLSIRNMCPVH